MDGKYKDKFDEAKYFLDRMKEEEGTYTFFKYNLSAFLASTRSIFQYAHEETKRNGNINWYNYNVANNRIFQFFRDERNAEIHKKPVTLSKSVIVHATPAILRVELPSNITEDRDKLSKQIGEIIFKAFSKKEATPEEKNLVEKCTLHYSDSPGGSTEDLYHFPNWSGTEDIITLCLKYLEQIEIFIDSGISDGYIL